MNYRLVGNSISSNKIKALKRTWNTYRNVENLSLPKVYMYFVSMFLMPLKKSISFIYLEVKMKIAIAGTDM